MATVDAAAVREDDGAGNSFALATTEAGNLVQPVIPISTEATWASSGTSAVAQLLVTSAASTFYTAVITNSSAGDLFFGVVNKATAAVDTDELLFPVLVPAGGTASLDLPAGYVASLGIQAVTSSTMAEVTLPTAACKIMALAE